MRAAARGGAWRASTAGLCRAFQQANLVILPNDDAAAFAAFCTRNPKPCPLIEITPPGEAEPKFSAPGADLRTDLPGYRVYRRGELAEKRDDVLDVWRDDMVAFLLGCSHTLENALAESGVPIRHIEQGTTVPMFVSSIRCLPAGRFDGPMVVTMRPVRRGMLPLVLELSARYPHAHGLPVHIGDPMQIGIADIATPDYGDAVELRPDEEPVFWACGVTPQAAVKAARPKLMITHEPGWMFMTDLPREAATSSISGSIGVRGASRSKSWLEKRGQD
jgi:uncharacterized protein YcsI (UPF0317 family)